MPLVYKLKYDFENPDFWGKDDFFFFKMDEAWLNASSLENGCMIFGNLDFFFFFFEKMMMMTSFFLKMNEAGPNAPSSTINVNFEKS